VARAWAQVKKILEANKRILYASFSLYVAEAVKKNFIANQPAEKKLMFFSPILKKVKGSPQLCIIKWTRAIFQLQQ
jgi:hypothetical protein